MNDNNKPSSFLRRTRLSSTGEPGPSDQDLTAAERATLDQTLRDSPFAVVLGAGGHSRACIQRIRSGRSMVCSCEPTQEEPDAAAAAVGRAIHFARMTKSSRLLKKSPILAQVLW